MRIARLSWLDTRLEPVGTCGAHGAKYSGASWVLEVNITMEHTFSPDDLVLALDTATPMQSLAIVRGAAVLFEAVVPAQTHDDGPGLLSLVDLACRQCSLRIGDFDRFAVTRGPGAFTGLRVSMAMLKSLALTLDRPLYAVSSLDAIARDALPCGDIVAACIDARRGELYAAFYDDCDGAVRRISDEMICKPADFAAYAASAFPGRRIACVGPAFPNLAKKLAEHGGDLVMRPANIRAATVARIVLERFPDVSPDIPLEALEPRYIRPDDFALPKPFDFTQPQYRQP